MQRLAARNLIAHDGQATVHGRALRERIEGRTDELASEPYAGIGGDRVGRLLTDLAPAAERIAGSGEIMFPNPMGLPEPAQSGAR